MQNELFETAPAAPSGFDRHQQPLTRAAGLAQLADFLPRAGRAYARDRNYDLGPEERANVSGLSPYLRHRLVTEYEVLSAVLTRHSPSAAEKFIQEVYWRTYWKGWLEHRSHYWEAYRAALGDHFAALNEDASSMAHYQSAIDGMTGIAPFDSWAQELVAHNYLHNHARMWFASIWIFTLKLPWELGADFFMQHLLDGDPASNTLSWRWVAGLQTRGKNYLARADNIARYTNDRFPPVSGLNELADALDEPEPEAPAAPVLKTLDETEISEQLTGTDDRSISWLIHEEDLHPESLEGFNDSLEQQRATCVAVLSAVPGRAAYGTAPAVTAAVNAAVADCAERLRSSAAGNVEILDPAALPAWLAQQQGDVFTPYAPTGPVRSLLGDQSRVTQIRREYDAVAWPYCRKGFFQLKKRIPELIELLKQGPM